MMPLAVELLTKFWRGSQYFTQRFHALERWIFAPWNDFSFGLPGICLPKPG